VLQSGSDQALHPIISLHICVRGAHKYDGMWTQYGWLGVLKYEALLHASPPPSFSLPHSYRPVSTVPHSLSWAAWGGTDVTFHEVPTCARCRAGGDRRRECENSVADTRRRRHGRRSGQTPPKQQFPPPQSGDGAAHEPFVRFGKVPQLVKGGRGRGGGGPLPPGRARLWHRRYRS